MSGKKIDNGIREKVIEDYTSGISSVKIAEKYHISRSSVGRIVKGKVTKQVNQNIKADKGKTERQKKIEDLERRIIALEKKIRERDNRRK